MAERNQEPAVDSFFGLTPDKVLEAVEAAGLSTRPVCYPLNSFENRVYEVELADRSRVVAKFYRPGRWSREQILEEHALLDALDREEIPVCTTRPFPVAEPSMADDEPETSRTLRRIDGLWYALWDRRGGRAPDELSDDAVRRLGAFVGRMHVVGARAPFRHRPALDADRYAREPLDFLLRHGLIPGPFRDRYTRAAEAIAEAAERSLRGVDTLRIHGDLHLGNILFRDGLLRVLDFDDAAMGPAVQDLWLALPGRDAWTQRQRRLLLEGYEQFRWFDDAELELVEPLRGLRMIRYCGWLARRRDDPAFRAAWPEFGSEDYWRSETTDLEEQRATIERAAASAPGRPDASRGTPAASAGANSGVDIDPSELTNADYFWDWEGD